MRLSLSEKVMEQDELRASRVSLNWHHYSFESLGVRRNPFF